MAPPTPSDHDEHGNPIYTLDDIAHHKKRKADGTPSVSIQGIPVSGLLRLEGPGKNDQPVTFARREGSVTHPIQFDCCYQQRREHIEPDGTKTVIFGKMCNKSFSGTYTSLNHKSLSRHAEKNHWLSSRTQVLVTEKSNKSIINFFLKRSQRRRSPPHSLRRRRSSRRRRARVGARERAAWASDADATILLAHTT